MSAVVQQVAPTATLAHPTLPVQYDFHPRGEDVAVVHTARRGQQQTYYLPAEEARQLWRNLTAKGYRRF